MSNATPASLAHLQLQARSSIAATLGLPDSEARIEAQTLLRRALGHVSRAWLIAHENDFPAPAQLQAFSALLERRLAGEPVAYVLGEREFFGLTFFVSPEVLIPRPDTETLVEAALNHIPPDAEYNVLDLGTGSGAIAIAIAANRPRSKVVAVDRSQTALQVARNNADNLGTCNVAFKASHWFGALQGEKFDVIVGNPPYIAEGDPHLAQGDLRFEPASALASGADGLDDIRAIVGASWAHLTQGGRLLLEHGYDQAEHVAALLRAAGFSEVASLPDLAGVLRVTQGRSV